MESGAADAAHQALDKVDPGAPLGGVPPRYLTDHPAYLTGPHRTYITKILFSTNCPYKTNLITSFPSIHFKLILSLLIQLHRTVFYTFIVVMFNKITYFHIFTSTTYIHLNTSINTYNRTRCLCINQDRNIKSIVTYNF